MVYSCEIKEFLNHKFVSERKLEKILIGDHKEFVLNLCYKQRLCNSGVALILDASIYKILKMYGNNLPYTSFCYLSNFMSFEGLVCIEKVSEKLKTSNTLL